MNNKYSNYETTASFHLREALWTEDILALYSFIMKSTMVSMMLLLLSTALVITQGGPQNMMIYNSMELNHPGKSRHCCDTLTFIE